MSSSTQWVLANSFIIRHKLLWYKRPIGLVDEPLFIVSEWPNGMISTDPELCTSTHISGGGNTLYEAVLDYQEKSGIGWSGKDV